MSRESLISSHLWSCRRALVTPPLVIPTLSKEGTPHGDDDGLRSRIRRIPNEVRPWFEAFVEKCPTHRSATFRVVPISRRGVSEEALATWILAAEKVTAIRLILASLFPQFFQSSLQVSVSCRTAASTTVCELTLPSRCQKPQKSIGFEQSWHSTAIATCLRPVDRPI